LFSQTLLCFKHSKIALPALALQARFVVRFKLRHATGSVLAYHLIDFSRYFFDQCNRSALAISH
jgi:hypothetical protein